MQSDFGLLYIATGEKYIREAIDSALSVRQIMPRCPIAIFTDNDKNIPSGLFDYTKILKNPTYSYFDKIDPLIESPFEKTLFLDTDTRLIAPIHDLITLLETFDIAHAHAPMRNTSSAPFDLEGVPDAFTEPNSGVILYKKNEKTVELFRNWSSYYKSQLDQKKKPIPDQPALRLALYKSDARIYVLPPEYNLRTIFPYFVGANAQVKILHGRGETLRKAALDVSRFSIQPRPRVSVTNLSIRELRGLLASKIANRMRRLTRRWKRRFTACLLMLGATSPKAQK
jgi:hypothetical protein